MACRVFFVPNTNEEVVDRVDAANGRRSQLFDKMANIVGKAKAYTKYLRTETPTFKNFFRGSEFTDSNNEPDLIQRGLDFYFVNGNQTKLAISRTEFSSDYLQQFEVLQQTATDRPSLNKVNDQAKVFLQKIGVSLKEVDEITDANGNKLNAVAKASMATKTVEFIQGKIDATSLPEEAAHFMVRILKNSKSPLYNSALKRIKDYQLYEDTYNEYKDHPLYQDADGNPNVDKITEEAIGKLVSENFTDIADKQATDAKYDLNRELKWYQKVLKKLRQIIETLIGQDPFFEISREMLHGEVNQYYKDEVASMQQTGEDFLQVDKSIPKQKQVVKQLEDMGKAVSLKELGLDEIEGLDSRLVEEGEETIMRYTYTDPKTGKVTTFTNRVSDKSQLAFVKKQGLEKSKKYNERNKDLAEGGTLLHGVSQKLVEMHANKADNLQVKSLTGAKIATGTASATAAIKIDPALKNTTLDPKAKLSKGVKSVINEISDLQKEIDKDAEATIMTEVPVFDPVSSTAGTIDLVVVFSDGSAGIYDFKFMTPIARYLSRDRKTLVEDPTQIKLDSYNAQIGQYKRILIDNYGVENVRRSRIVPAHVQYKDIKKGNSYKRTDLIRVLEMGAEQSEFMRQLAVAGETTNFKGINKLLKDLSRRRERLQVQYQEAKGKDKLAINENIKRIDRQMQGLLVDGRIAVVLQDIASGLQTIDKRLSVNDPKHKDYLSTEELIDVLDDFGMYEGLAQDVSEYFVDMPEGESKTKLQTLIAIAGTEVAKSTTAAKTKLHERLVDLGTESGVDITEKAKRLDALDRYMVSMSDSPNPMVRLAHSEIRKSLNRTEQESRRVDEKMMYAHTKVQEWAKQNGTTVAKAFDKLINSKTGNLVARVNKEFYEEIKERQDRGTAEDIAWLKKNLKPKEGAKEIYNEWLANAKKNAQAFHPDIKDENGKVVKSQANARNNYIKSFKNRFDVFNSPQAYLSDGWSVFLEITPESLEANKNSEFAELEKPENKALLFYYNNYVEVNREIRDAIGTYIPESFVSNMQDSWLEMAVNDGLFAALGGMKEYLDRQFTHRNDQGDSIGVLDSDGNLISRIPLPGMVALRDSKGNIDNSLKSKDLTKSLMLFARGAYNFKHMNAIEANIIAMSEILSDPQFSEETKTNGVGKIIRKDGVVQTGSVSPETIAYFNSMKDFYLYGHTTQGKDVEILGISAKRALKAMMSTYSFKVLALPVIPGAAARIAAEVNMVVNGVDGLHYTNKQRRNAEIEMLKNYKEVRAFANYFNVYQQGTSWKRHQDAAMKKGNKYLNLESMYGPLRQADENVEDVLTRAMGYNHGIDENGNLQRIEALPEGSKNLVERTTFDKKTGKFSIEGLEEAAYIDFQTRVKAVAGKIKGRMDNSDIKGYEVHMLGQAGMHFKGWMPDLSRAYFGNTKYDTVLDTLDEGRFTGTGKEMFREAWSQERGLASNLKSTLGESANLVLQLMYLKKYQGDPKRRAELKAKGKWTDAQEEAYQLRRESLAMEMEMFKRESTDPRVKALTDVDAYAAMRSRSINQTMTNLRAIIASYAILSALSALGPDDDKWVAQNKAVRILMKVLFKSQLELGFVVNPSDIVGMIRSPFPVIGLLIDAQKIVTNGIQETMELITGDVNKRDKTPLGYHTFKFVPGFNQGRRVVEIFEQDRQNPYDFDSRRMY
jgi:hypothetical protein